MDLLLNWQKTSLLAGAAFDAACEKIKEVKPIISV
jgi:hypothetical protein